MITRRRVGLVVVGLATMAGCAKPQPLGKLDLKDIGGYVKRLNASDTPAARAIRKQLADGAADRTREWEAVRKDGLPVTPDELQRPSPPPDQDAAPDYVKLTALLKAKPLGKDAEKALYATASTHMPSAADIAAAMRLLADRQDIVALVHAATAKPKCVFRRRWELGPGMPTPEYPPMRMATRVLRAESYLLAIGGHDREAVTMMSRGFRLAEHAASDPTILSHLVGSAIDSMTLAGLEDTLQMAGPNAEVAGLIRRTVEQQRPRFDLRRAYAGELVSHMVAMASIRNARPEELWPLGVDPSELAQTLSQTGSLPAQPRQTITPEGRKFASQLADAAEASIVRDLHRLATNSALPAWERIARGRRTSTQAEGPNNPVSAIRNVFMPVYDNIDTNDARTAARENTLIAGAAVLPWRAQHGEFPAHLDEAIVPPRDPFRGKPLRYRRDNDGFVVYSTGPDGRFDGGKPGMAPHSQQAYFRYPTRRQGG